jgi:hypothetical protein
LLEARKLPENNTERGRERGRERIRGETGTGTERKKEIDCCEQQEERGGVGKRQ